MTLNEKNHGGEGSSSEASLQAEGSTLPDICVAHLVWKPLGPAPFSDFVDSYRRNPGGVAHRLILIFNGFAAAEETREYQDLLQGLDYEPLFIFPPVQDLAAYLETARRVECDYFCFLNSYSVLLDSEWLAKLYFHARQTEVGVVGATGSWQSGYSYLLFEQGRPSAYTESLKDYYCPRSTEKRKWFELSGELRAQIRLRRLPWRAMSSLYYWGLAAPFYCLVNSVRYSLKDRINFIRKERAIRRRFSVDFDAFPARHVRTNAFMIRRTLLLGLQNAAILNKDDAYRFESGKKGLTGQLLRAGMRALVVGRDGRAYEPDQWHLSETLWQGEQKNLLVSDNQTNDYEHGSPRHRVFLSRRAWGNEAAPSSVDPSRKLSDEFNQVGEKKHI